MSEGIENLERNKEVLHSSELFCLYAGEAFEGITCVSIKLLNNIYWTVTCSTAKWFNSAMTVRTVTTGME